jgi:aminoglycoside phosphotransferase (APT) family kinase protein
MTRPWSAEQVVSPALAALLLADQFPALVASPPSVELLGVGWDNTVYRVDGVYAVRFPRRSVAVPLLEAEQSLLPWVAPQLPLPIPVPTLHGRPDRGYPWPFLGYGFLAGRAACTAALTDSERAATAEPLGRFLAALHALPIDEARRRGAGPDALGKVDVGKRVPLTLRLLDQLASPGSCLPAELPLDLAGLRAIAEESRLITAPDRLALTHGDLYARHLLLDDHRLLCGVIDWGDIHIGHPAVDLSIAHGFLPRAARDRFRRAYGTPIDEQTWRLARLRALFIALSLVVYAQEVSDGGLLREAITSVGYIAA